MEKNDLGEEVLSPLSDQGWEIPVKDGTSKRLVVTGSRAY